MAERRGTKTHFPSSWTSVTFRGLVAICGGKQETSPLPSGRPFLGSWLAGSRLVEIEISEAKNTVNEARVDVSEGARVGWYFSRWRIKSFRSVSELGEGTHWPSLEVFQCTMENCNRLRIAVRMFQVVGFRCQWLWLDCLGFWIGQLLLERASG